MYGWVKVFFYSEKFVFICKRIRYWNFISNNNTPLIMRRLTLIIIFLGLTSFIPVFSQEINEEIYTNVLKELADTKRLNFDHIKQVYNNELCLFFCSSNDYTKALHPRNYKLEKYLLNIWPNVYIFGDFIQNFEVFT